MTCNNCCRSPVGERAGATKDLHTITAVSRAVLKALSSSVLAVFLVVSFMVNTTLSEALVSRTMINIRAAESGSRLISSTEADGSRMKRTQKTML